MKIKIKTFLTIFLFLFVSCSKESNPDSFPPSIAEDENPAIISAEQTIIVYMAADNNLSTDAFDDIEEMKESFEDTGINLVIFIDPVRESPYLLEITHSTDTIIKTYQEFNSADASQMQQVLNDIIEMYPSDSYGLILWSHGTSWLPSGQQLKSFGRDNSEQIDIPDLAEALPVRFDFILFDACLMGAVEVAYELRNKTDYIISSSAEVIYTGFPYDLIIPALVSSTPDLRKAAESYFDYYQQQSGAFRSATISLVDTKELDNLARVTNQLISGQTFDIASFDKTSVQRLDVYDEQYTFDFLDFIIKAFPEADKRPLIEQLEKTVLYKAHTAEFIEMYEINAYCGLSCYIPHSSRNDLNSYYKQLSWYQAGGYNKLF
ncbi:MAG: hypothetical protein LBS43_12430 [Prevotellaceae bacterium]|jgi:hypothetical protein|nr:hypothetical protein [Prevotellaceae bacterium]